jgi:hypothetical protein
MHLNDATFYNVNKCLLIDGTSSSGGSINMIDFVWSNGHCAASQGSNPKPWDLTFVSQSHFKGGTIYFYPDTTNAGASFTSVTFTDFMGNIFLPGTTASSLDGWKFSGASVGNRLVGNFISGFGNCLIFSASNDTANYYGGNSFDTCATAPVSDTGTANADGGNMAASSSVVSKRNTLFAAAVGVLSADSAGALTGLSNSMTIAGHTVALGGSQAIACGDLSNGATGCSTATGTSGATLPLLNGTNTWASAQTFAGGVGITGGSFVGNGQLYKDPNQGLAVVGVAGLVNDFNVLTPSGGAFLMHTPTGTNYVKFDAPAVLGDGYTVATLPSTAAAGKVTGARTYVTDQLTTCVATGAALTGGGAVVCPAFYNGSAWVGG